VIPVGRIKTKLIKRFTGQLLAMHRSEFTKDFEENKKLVDKFSEIESAKIRNAIAGYVTRLVKGEKE